MAIDEFAAQRILMVRAAEQDAAPGPLSATRTAPALLPAALRQSAEQRTARELGGHADPAHLLARRAELLCEALGSRDSTLHGWLAASRWPRWSGPALIAAAALLGLATDAIGQAGRINLLAAPLLGVLAWNMVVVAASVVTGLAARISARTKPTPRRPTGHAPNRARRGRGAWLAATLTRLSRLRMSLAPSAGSPIGSATGPAQQWRMRFLADWLSASAPLRRARASGLLHGAAAALASGMLAGLYLRGLAFEYRAGWESTFLGPQAVRALLGSVLGPASALSGLPLPDVAALAKLRFSIGQGEIANQWIHLIGITLLLFAIVPRLTCAIVAWRNASRLRDDFPIDCQDPTLSEAVRRMRGQGASIRVLPCGWRASHSALAALEKSLVAEFGSDATVTAAPTLAPEQADDPQNLPPLLDADRVVVLFNLSVTPEPETHGAFLRVVARHMGAGATLAAWIDESAFASRFAGQPRRLEERRAAWRSMLKAQAVPERFVQLEQPT